MAEGVGREDRAGRAPLAVAHGLHDLGNVLALILSHAETLLSDVDISATHQKGLQAIRAHVLKAGEILRDVHRATRHGADARDAATMRPTDAEAGAPIAILLIENEAEIRWGYGELLRKAGYDVEVAASGLEGIASYRRRRFDCVISDLVMPVMNGLMVSRAIKDHDPAAYVVLLSGGPEPDSAALRGAGVDRVALKPLNEQELIRLAEIGHRAGQLA